jgi:hypothetical protein
LIWLGWLAGWLVGWLAGWLVGWLVWVERVMEGDAFCSSPPLPQPLSTPAGAERGANSRIWPVVFSGELPAEKPFVTFLNSIPPAINTKKVSKLSLLVEQQRPISYRNWQIA